MQKRYAISENESVIAIEEHVSSLYRRTRLEGVDFPFQAQYLQFSSKRKLRLVAGVDVDALSIDFRFETTRRDIPDLTYVSRPGVFLSRIARVYSEAQGTAVLFNGNNIGYWGNQFLIVGGVLKYKKTAPLFYDPTLNVSGTYSFITQSNSGEIGFRWISVQHIPVAEKDKVALVSISPTNNYVSGVSGFPLIEMGHVVWDKHIEQAWDPKLLYHVGDLYRVRESTIIERLKHSHLHRKPLQRHSLTFLGVNLDGVLFVLTVEEIINRSRGISLAEASTLLLDLQTKDCIVLGGKGDAQLVSTEEGVLVYPLISSHDREVSKTIDHLDLESRYIPGVVLERPVPSYVSIIYY